MARKKIEIYDTTLRDGNQGEGVSLSLGDKLDIAKALDSMGIDFIEEDIVEAKNIYKKENLTFIFDDAYEYLSREEKKHEIIYLQPMMLVLLVPDEISKFYGFFFVNSVAPVN